MLSALCLVLQYSKCIWESWNFHWCQQEKKSKCCLKFTHTFLFFVKNILFFLPFLTHAWPPEWRWCVPTNIKILIPIPFGVLVRSARWMLDVLCRVYGIWNKYFYAYHIRPYFCESQFFLLFISFFLFNILSLLLHLQHGFSPFKSIDSWRFVM